MSQPKDYLVNLTVEQRLQMVIKSKNTRDAKRAWGEEHLKQDYGQDEAHWRALASEAGIRLPAKYIPSSDTKYLKRILKKLNIEAKEWLDVEGYTTLKDFSVNNPTWPSYAHIGLLLEYWKENKE